MEIILKRKVIVKKYKALLDIGIKERRSDIIALLLIAKSHNDQLSIPIICNEFIFRDNETIAKRIIQRCQDLALLDKNLKITEEGLIARDDEMIYYPFTGKYYLWVTEDPIFPQRILNIEMVNEKINLKQEIKGYKWEYVNGERIKMEIENNIISVPEWLKHVESFKNIILFNEDKKDIRIQKIEEKIEPISIEELETQIKISDKLTLLKLSGIFNDEREIPFFPNIRTIWEQILKDKYQMWDWSDESMRLRYNDVSSEEKKKFTKTFNFSDPIIEKYGKFESIDISLKIKPESDEEATLWANWLLENQFQEFMFPLIFKRYKNQISSKFHGFNIALKSVKEISEAIMSKMFMKEIPNDFWFIIAPLDVFPINFRGDE
ncbi:hypothetical protein LCGC14_1029360 [marine sediment metagenome]|uniref:Uncharacterized protein n=1 Tax=marine sediment metagenome TaxID=412755 RepID=A0A0F9QD50_9ZZZZ